MPYKLLKQKCLTAAVLLWKCSSLHNMHTDTHTGASAILWIAGMVNDGRGRRKEQFPVFRALCVDNGLDTDVRARRRTVSDVENWPGLWCSVLSGSARGSSRIMWMLSALPSCRRRMGSNCTVWGIHLGLCCDIEGFCFFLGGWKVSKFNPLNSVCIMYMWVSESAL